MVMPITHEVRPKCFLCHEDFADIEALREHQEASHKDFAERHQNSRTEPAPGDVTLF